MLEKFLKYWSKKNVLIGAGVAAGVGLAILLRVFWADMATLVGVPKPLTAEEIVAKDLGWASQESMSGIGPGLTPVRELFGQARQGSRLFVEDALGWDSKWKLVKDYFSNDDEHGKFLQEQFSTRIFSPEQLQSAVESSVSAYIRHLEDVDSQLLVRLQADLSSVPSEQFVPGVDRNAIQQILDAAMREARTAASSDFRGMVEREIVSMVAGEVLSAAAVQLATSTGILGAGAASGTVTFGAGLVVGVITDWAVSWAYDRLYDPVGDLTNKINQQLDELERMIVVGDAERPGLATRLQDYSQRRSQARDAAIRGAILPSVPSAEHVEGFFNPPGLKGFKFPSQKTGESI
jgi:hypothetical protein